jgi:hypothetical protein
MDGDAERFRKRLAELFDEVTEVAVRLDAAERKGAGLVHFSQIEMGVEARVKELGRQMVTRAAREVAAEAVAEAKCPGCGRKCPVKTSPRPVQSLHGPVELLEPQGFCPSCRRSFFPAAGSVGVRQPGVDADAGAADCDRRGRDAVG